MSMDKTVIDEATRMSFNSVPFPETLKVLAATKVRSYRKDLVRLRAAYYGPNGDSYESALPLDVPPPIAETFDAATVVAALKAIQRKEIGYPEFLRRIMRAGCTNYFVFLDGRHALYLGRDGDSHREDFPPSP